MKSSKTFLNITIVFVMLLSLMLTSPVSAEGASISKVTVTRTYNGSSGTVTVWEGGWVNQNVTFDYTASAGITITIYVTGGSANYYYQAENTTSGWIRTATTSATNYNFYPTPPIAGYYRAEVDGNWIGGLISNTFRLIPQYSDMDITAGPTPNATSPFCVGQLLNWTSTTTNLNSSATGSSPEIGYYIGTSSGDYSTQWDTDGLGSLDGGESSSENQNYTFTASDAGSRYMNFWADWDNEIPETNETNNTASYGPFTVNPKVVSNFTTNKGTTPTISITPGTTVNFTDSSTGNPNTWYWTFGDGGSSTSQNPSHMYNSTGTFSVTLSASNSTNTCGGTPITITDLFYVAYTPVVTDFTTNHGDTAFTVYKGVSVQFTDQTSGDPTSWSWNFGDGGTSTLQNPLHAYNTTATFDVSLTASGPGGSDTETKIGLVTVIEAPPCPDFSASPNPAEQGDTVSFTNQTTYSTSCGPVSSWLWNFGDGNSSTSESPTHAYSAVYTYTVSLQATGAGGTVTETKDEWMAVNPPCPVAEFTADNWTPLEDTLVSFTDQSTGTISSRLWDFDDGNFSALTNPTNTFTDPGTYHVTLTVNGPGCSDDVTHDVGVIADIVPTIRYSHFTNITDGSVTVSWLTNVAATSSVNYGTTVALGSTDVDDRGTSHVDDTHFITLTGLSPSTTYYVDLISGTAIDDNGGSHYTVTTAPTLGSPPSSDTVYGQVFLSDGTTPAEGAIVYFTIQDNDGSGTSGTSSRMSSLVDEDGYWYSNLGNVRTQNLSSAFSYSSSGDKLVFDARGGADGSGSAIVDTSNDYPTPHIYLGDLLKFLPLVVKK
jgi:PKD repeat protein